MKERLPKIVYKLVRFSVLCNEIPDFIGLQLLKYDLR